MPGGKAVVVSHSYLCFSGRVNTNSPVLICGLFKWMILIESLFILLKGIVSSGDLSNKYQKSQTIGELLGEVENVTKDQPIRNLKENGGQTAHPTPCKESFLKSARARVCSFVYSRRNALKFDPQRYVNSKYELC